MRNSRNSSQDGPLQNLKCRTVVPLINYPWLRCSVQRYQLLTLADNGRHRQIWDLQIVFFVWRFANRILFSTVVRLSAWFFSSRHQVLFVLIQTGILFSHNRWLAWCKHWNSDRDEDDEPARPPRPTKPCDSVPGQITYWISNGKDWKSSVKAWRKEFGGTTYSKLGSAVPS
jgi:hypothetical protein